MSTELRAVAAAPEQKGLAIQNFNDLERIAGYLAGSKLIPVPLQNKPADVAIILWKAHELGFSPMQGMDSIDVIQGKPALKPEAQLALIYSRVPEAEVQIEQDHQKVLVKVTMKRPGKSPYTATWDMARAKQLGLDQKPNYKAQPMTMLKWRAVGEAARTVFSDITRGMYNTEEATDFTNENVPQVDKAAELASRLNDKPVEKEIHAEVAQAPKIEVPTQPTPVLDPTTAADLESPAPGPSAGDYIPKVHAYKGQPLKTLGLVGAQDYLTKLLAAAKTKGAKLTGDWLELATRLEQYVVEEMDKAEAPAQTDPDFGDFKP